MAKAMLIDVSKCTGCRACQVACKQWNELPAEETTNRGTYENPPDLSYNTWTKVIFKETGSNGTLRWLFRKHQCMHCTDASCVEVCAPKALQRHPTLGFVTYDPSRCSSCGYCVEYCPFHVPRMRYSLASGMGKMGKCSFCFDRVSNGYEPACAKACPTGAIEFGERSELITKGKERVEVLRDAHPDVNLYGENEMGGLHMMYVLDERPEVYDLPVDPQMPASAIAHDIIKPVGIGLAIAAGGAMLLNAMIARERIVAEEEGKSAKE